MIETNVVTQRKKMWKKGEKNVRTKTVNKTQKSLKAVNHPRYSPNEQGLFFMISTSMWLLDTCDAASSIIKF